MIQSVSLARRAAELTSNIEEVESPDAIMLEFGCAFPGILPDLTDAAERALTLYRSETLQYSDMLGLRELREWIAGYMSEHGANISLDEIMVVNGAKHGVELACRLLLEEGDAIVVTAPTYFTAIPIFRSFGAKFINVGQDSEGINVEQIEDNLTWLKREGRKPPKFIYDIPDFHNPTGVSMTRGRRQALVELAEQHGIFIVEDSPYRKIRFEGDEEPSLKSLDRSGRVLAVGTFSKLLAPGLRIGWIAAQRDLLGRMMQLKSDGGPSPLLQRITIEFCKKGGIEEHTLEAQQIYRMHRDCMVEALRRYIPDVEVEVPMGGYYIWLTLPRDIDGDELERRGKKEGVGILAGSKCFAGQSDEYPRNVAIPNNHMRLAFSYASPAEIDEGIKRLARAYTTMRA